MGHEETREPTGAEIAIVGMAGRFPGAESVGALWENLRGCVESVSRFTDEELRETGIDEATLADPAYVRAFGMMEGPDLFDAGFFGFSHRDAEITDPQQRVFLETAWTAMEDAGYAPGRVSGAVGVYAGTSTSIYLLRNLLPNRSVFSDGAGMEVMVANDKDFLAPRVAYKLGLRGPAVTVQTACSTSLVAVHVACRALLGGECDLALAGGVSIHTVEPRGYVWRPGGILSPDARCRAFDVDAAGAFSGAGAGVVVLKRLDDALADGDTIHAVILGSAINNDGHGKAGFTAPGADGQTAVITDALGLAGIDARSVGYVEAHGTATPLGDPVEVAALTRAYRAYTEDTGYCTLGSVKSNLGHLDAAAGVTGLIKATLAVREGIVPGTLHFRAPNPRLELERTPFVVRAETAPWAGPHPRRAGVSSFGIGGTNAHLVLEEPPAPEPRSGTPRAAQLLVVSARSAEACAAYARALADHLDRAAPDLADAAFTTQVGRVPMEWRIAVAAATPEEAAGALRSAVPHRSGETKAPDAPAFDPAGTDPRAAAEALGRAWCAGAEVDWEAYAAGRGARRIPLPTYPFERRRYYIDAPRSRADSAAPAAAGAPASPPAEEAPAPRHARPELGTAFVAPSTELEETIAAIWSELLSTDGIGVHDNFFELGGHSLLGTRVVARLRTLFGVDLPVEVVFRAPTVHVLAQVVEAALLEALESMSEEEALGLA